MYLNAIFVITDDIFKELNKLTPAKRLKFILGSDGIDNFAKQLIDMEDYYETTTLFYSVLTSNEFNLSELKPDNMICLYDNESYMAYCVEGRQLENLTKKLSNISSKTVRKAFGMHGVRTIEKDLVSPIEKFERFGALMSVADKKEAHLLVMMQNDE